jgi:osmotically-inducible protein OsmY
MMTRVPSLNVRTAALLLALSTAPLLQGCFPLVAAGAGTAALVAADRRQPEIVLGDQRIEATASTRMGNEISAAHVNVTSFNYVVLLTGEAPSEQLKAEAERIAAAIPQVKSVVNEIQVAAPSAFAARSNDTYLTGKVKAGFLSADKFAANDVKVVTEAGVVYLMGLVTRKEADDATEAARSTGGVRKVVRVFEYIAAAPTRTSSAPASGRTGE